MERGLASFDIYAIVSELQDLIGCYVEKIYQLSRNEILLRVQQKTANQKTSLFIRNGELLCLTQREFETPEKPSLFAMTLRKYLLNGKISEISQHEFDRIVSLKIARKEGTYTVVCELFSKGNIILCDPEGRIIRPLSKQEWASRLLKSGEMYVPPPSQTNPFTITEQKFQELLKKSQKDLVRTLASTMNLSGLYAEELCFRAGIQKTTTISLLTEEQINNIYAELRKFLAVFQEKRMRPVYVKKNGVIIDVLPVPFQSYADAEVERIESFSKGLELCITDHKAVQIPEALHQKQIEKLHRQLAQQEGLIEEFKKSIQQKKLEGDLLYLNFQACDALLQEIASVMEQKEKEEGIEKIRRNALVRQFDPTANELVVLLYDGAGRPNEISLDFRKTIAENAEQKYEEGKKLQEKLKGGWEAVEHTKQQLKTIQETEIVETKKKVSHEKQWWFERFRWFISTEGNIIVAGRDAASNDVVVKKYLSQGDRYAHADIHGAPSCVIKSKGINDEELPISEKTLEEACRFAASYSRAWNQFGEAQAYWVLPEQVSKTPESGEYVPKGAFIIRGKRNYARYPLEVAVGLIHIDTAEKLMGGPVTSVSARAEKYAVLVPGVTKKSDIAKKLAKVFHVSTDIVEKVLPPGDVTLVKAVGFTL